MKAEIVSRNLPFNSEEYDKKDVVEPYKFDGLNYLNYTKHEIVRMYVTLYDSYQNDYIASTTPIFGENLPAILDEVQNSELVAKFEKKREEYNNTAGYSLNKINTAIEVLEHLLVQVSESSELNLGQKAKITLGVTKELREHHLSKEKIQGRDISRIMKHTTSSTNDRKVVEVSNEELEELRCQ